MPAVQAGISVSNTPANSWTSIRLGGPVFAVDEDRQPTTVMTWAFFAEPRDKTFVSGFAHSGHETNGTALGGNRARFLLHSDEKLHSRNCHRIKPRCRNGGRTPRIKVLVAGAGVPFHWRSEARGATYTTRSECLGSVCYLQFWPARQRRKRLVSWPAGPLSAKLPQLIHALDGNRISDHLRFIIRSCLRHLACLEEEIEDLDGNHPAHGDALHLKTRSPCCKPYRG